VWWTKNGRRRCRSAMTQAADERLSSRRDDLIPIIVLHLLRDSVGILSVAGIITTAHLPIVVALTLYLNLPCLPRVYGLVPGLDRIQHRRDSHLRCILSRLLSRPALPLTRAAPRLQAGSLHMSVEKARSARFPGIVESSSTPPAVRPGEEDGCRPSSRGCCRSALIAGVPLRRGREQALLRACAGMAWSPRISLWGMIVLTVSVTIATSVRCCRTIE
jgi:hypothetical protein